MLKIETGPGSDACGTEGRRREEISRGGFLKKCKMSVTIILDLGLVGNFLKQQSSVFENVADIVEGRLEPPKILGSSTLRGANGRRNTVGQPK